jgi:hypothetical protein
MPKTNAERQRDHRQRQTRRHAALETRCAELEADLNATRAELRDALEDNQRLAAAACKHPV